MTRNLIAAALLLAPGLAAATDVTVVGLFPGKAVVTIDRGAPRTLSVGQKTSEGVMLVSVDGKAAVIEVDGKKQTLEMGQHFESAASTGARDVVTLAADARGHFVTQGQVNGNSVRFLVDTGATLVALPAADARRLGIDYEKGTRGYSSTAGGVVPVYRVKLDSVSIGGIELLGVEAVVLEGRGMDVALLGMSFLNRTEMRREGTTLTLTKRF
jgi:aspartyl protease family protein